MIHHHIHSCPLVRHEYGAFTCNGCGCGGKGSRYRCHKCDFDLHLACATYSFPCHKHALMYEPRCPARVHITCDACKTQVCGAHYGCGGCNFHVHPTCVRQRRTVVPSSTPTPRSCSHCGRPPGGEMSYCNHCNQRRRCS